MAVDIRKLRAIVEAEITDFLENMRRADDAFDKTGENAGKAGETIAAGMEKGEKATKSLADRLESAGARLTAFVSTPLLALGKRANDMAIQLDGLKRGLTSITGSADEAERQFARLQEVAKLPGLGMAEAAQGSINLQAAGFSALQAESALKAFGNALAIVGKGKADLSEVVNQLQQIGSTGKASAEDIKVIASRVPQVRAAMKEAFGTSSTEAISKMGIDGVEIINRLVAVLQKLPQATDSARNKMENVADTADRSFARVGASVNRVITGPMQQLADVADELTKHFESLPKWQQDLITGLGGIAASVGPLALATAQIIKMKEALSGAQLVLMGPVGLIAAIALLGAAVAKAGLDNITEQAEANINKLASQNAIPALKERKAQLEAMMGPLGRYIALEEKAQTSGSSKLYMPSRTDNLEGLKAAGATFNSNGEIEAAGANLSKYIGYYVQLEDELHRVDKAATSLQKKIASEKPYKPATPVVPTFDVAQTEKLKAQIAQMQEQIATFGDKSEYAKIRFAILHGEFSKASPAAKALAESLAKQLDALQANADAAKKAEEYIKKYTAALNESKKARELAMIHDDDTHALRKRFEIEQKYADPKEKLKPADAAKVLTTLDKTDTENGERDNKQKLIDLHKKLEESVKSLMTTNAAYLSGHEKLTHAEEAQAQIDKLNIAMTDRYGNSLAKRLMAQAQLADSNEAWAKSWDKAEAGGQKYLASLQSLTDEASGLVNAYNEASDTGTKYDTVVAKLTAKYRDLAAASLPWQRLLIWQQIQMAATAAQDTETLRTTTRFKDALADVTERLTEATGHGDAYQKVLARMKVTAAELTPEQAELAHQIADATKQLEHLEKRKREVENIAGRLSTPFRDAFDEMFQKGGKAGIQRFTQEMKSSLSSMFADLLGNQVKNALTAMLTPLYDDLTSMLKSSIASLQDALSGMHLSVNQIAATVYGMLAALGQQGKKRQGGAILGGILGGIAGSFLPGGWMLGAQIGSSLGGALSGGNAGEIAVAGFNAAGAYSSIGGGGSGSLANSGYSLNGGGSSGNWYDGGAAASRAVANVNVAVHGDINNLGGLNQMTGAITGGVRAGLRTTR